ncbi:uncharacterized protein YjiK [Gelidibacter sediminis]|uniref:Uncharacterized protein YjiK n=1 Tax=Gelidibacter sediminis TaxID=1608710 RepID=A0A4V3F8E5_9FLAO|nr:SdiA-regulated domain-containing protein [Gelidibacter sediminis]TDU40066.1 uncharacterized protein YjiK [Gelidibacter sediminis]
MKKSTIYIGFFVALLIGIAVIGFAKVNDANAELKKGSANYTIEKTWELPSDLDEVSGIVWLDNKTIACVQDEDGIVYIYDLNTKTITRKIPFADHGDFEAIARYKNDLYVMQSDGLLYEIKDWDSEKKSVSSYQTDFESSNNIESLTYSNKEGTLLTVPKDTDLKDDYKGIYSISLSSQNMDRNSPTYKIEMASDILKPFRHKKLQKTFYPSEIAVHPTTKEIYILEGRNPKLLIMDPQGTPKWAYKLDELNFPQPEGMTFSATGDLYISNESAGGPATIHLVKLKFK